MKWRLWIGGVLLLAVLWGTIGCGETREQGGDHMVDGPDMVYTPEDQSPSREHGRTPAKVLFWRLRASGSLKRPA